MNGELTAEGKKDRDVARGPQAVYPPPLNKAGIFSMIMRFPRSPKEPQAPKKKNSRRKKNQGEKPHKEPPSRRQFLKGGELARTTKIGVPTTGEILDLTKRE